MRKLVFFCFADYAQTQCNVLFSICRNITRQFKRAVDPINLTTEPIYVHYQVSMESEEVCCYVVGRMWVKTFELGALIST